MIFSKEFCSLTSSFFMICWQVWGAVVDGNPARVTLSEQVPAVTSSENRKCIRVVLVWLSPALLASLLPPRSTLFTANITFCPCPNMDIRADVAAMGVCPNNEVFLLRVIWYHLFYVIKVGLSGHHTGLGPGWHDLTRKLAIHHTSACLMYFLVPLVM